MNMAIEIIIKKFIYHDLCLIYGEFLTFVGLYPQMRIFVALEAVDFRKGIDGLCRLCRDKMKTDPFSGSLFVFRNRRRTSIKLLFYDGQGYWICQKRLSQGRFNWWPQSAAEQVGSLAVHELQVLLWNGNPQEAQVSPFWKKVSI